FFAGFSGAIRDSSRNRHSQFRLVLLCTGEDLRPNRAGSRCVERRHHFTGNGVEDRMSNARIWSFVAAIMMVGTAVPGWAEEGVSTGGVADPAAAVLPGVGITLTGAGIMGERTAASDEQGGFRFTLLPSGSYNLKFELPGFKTLIREGIQISAGFTATIN